MKFGASDMSVWLWAVPLVLVFFSMAKKHRKRAMEKFADLSLLKELTGSWDPGKNRLKNAMLVLALVMLIFGLMRPQWGFQWQEVKRRGLDIIIALDTSNSMLAEDVLPSRISRAKLAIKDLVKKLHGDRVGLVAFAGTSFLQCPLTIDYDGFLLSLDDVDVDTIPIGGTSLSNAIYKSIESFEGGKNQEKILIVITDGEDLEGGVEAAIQKARASGVKIFCVGIGSDKGELIPVFDEKGKMAFLKDEEGNVVKTRLREDLLQRMAIETGGMYVHATGAEFGLSLIYDERLSKLQKQDFESRMEKRYYERFQIPLTFAIFLLFIQPLIGDKRRGAGL